MTRGEVEAALEGAQLFMLNERGISLEEAEALGAYTRKLKELLGLCG